MGCLPAWPAGFGLTRCPAARRATAVVRDRSCHKKNIVQILDDEYNPSFTPITLHPIAIPHGGVQHALV